MQENRVEESMREMNEQKYSRNMALSLLAGIALGAVITLALLWALGYFPGKGQAVETSFSQSQESGPVSGDLAELPGNGQSASADSSEPQNGDGQRDNSSGPEIEPGQDDSASEGTQDKLDSEEEEGSPSVRLDFRLKGGWDGEGCHYYQYVGSIINDSGRKITDWEITVPGFEGCEVDSHWCCELGTEDGSLIITPADFNREIWENSRVEGIGITVAAEKEWELTEAVLEAETAEGKITAALGDAPLPRSNLSDGQNENAPEVNSGNGQTSGQETGKPGVQEAGQRPDQGAQSQGAANQGAKGPEIQAGDELGGFVVAQGTPVGDHGRLWVENGSLVDQQGEAYQMHGVSTHGLAWFPEYVSEETFRTFRNDWDADLMRLAMYSGENGGYSNGGDRKELKNLIDRGVEYASGLGMYVIIDWHVLGEGNPNIYKEDAIEFFDEMSRKYGDQGNVIYEICNEPNGGVSWKDVKKYAEEVIPVIRANDPYGIILVGTPQWSQLIGDAAADPIEGYDNIMYTLHFYAATHGENLRGDLEKALKDGLPVFVSECSICDASGNGNIDEKSARAWVDLLDQYNVSYVAWAASNKNETAALISSGCGKLSDWSDQELSETGRWFKAQFTK